MGTDTVNDAATVGTGSDAAQNQPASDPAPSLGANPSAQPAPTDGLGAPASNDSSKQSATAGVEPAANDWVGAPEGTYSAEGFDLPEGYEVNEATAEGLAQVCKEMGLSQKAFATIINRMTPVMEKAQADQIAAFKQENLKAFYNDKELGGAKAKETIAQAKTAYEKYCPEECRQILNRLGLDAHPGMIKMFYQLSQILSDDVSPRSGGSTPSIDDLERSFFNNSKMN